MMRRMGVGLTLAVLFLGMASLPGSTSADAANQVGLVIQFDGDRVETRCVSFEGDSITGGEVLERAGLDVIVDSSGGMGLTLCKVEDVGCSFPAEHCFCQCMGGAPCTYWNYFYRDPDGTGWVYSPLGAAYHKATPGSVEAWVWGDGHTAPAEDLTFEAICAEPTAVAAAPTAQPETQSATTPTATLPMEASPAPSVTPITPEATPEPAASPSRSPVPAASPTEPALPTASPTPLPTANGGSGMSTYLPFGFAVLALASIGAIAWLRRTR